MVATELLAEGGELDEDDVRERLSGNLCRCTGYQGIVEAVLAVARRSAPSA
jgi:carbon-monoxide dehydrogenase small subunit